MTNAKYVYWKRRRNNVCVACEAPTNGTARCQVCAKKCSIASAKSQKKRLDMLKARIAELEGNA